MINLSNNAIICMHQDRMAICGSGLTTDLTYTTEKIRMYIVFELNNKTLFVVISFTKYPTQNPAFYGYQPL